MLNKTANNCLFINRSQIYYSDFCYKKMTWLHLLLIELGFLSSKHQYTLIEVLKGNTCIQSIHQDLFIAYREELKLRILGRKSSDIVILLKSDNQKSITLAHNSILYLKTKLMNIEYYYILNEVAFEKIELSYISMEEIIVDGLIKILIRIKFHRFIEQIIMTGITN